MKKRVLLAGLFHETHTFLQGRTTLVDFTIRRGTDMLARCDRDSPLAGALEVSVEAGWEVLPVIDLRASPGAKVSDEVIKLFLNEIENEIHRNLDKGIDGIYLVLHGAMVSESVDDVEGYILSKIKKATQSQSIPVCGVIDLHANFTADMAQNSDGLIAYRRNPHTDSKQAAADAAKLLDRLMKTGERPRTVWLHPPIMWPPTGTDTDTNPMRYLEAAARQIEARDRDIFAVNVFAGFGFADMPDTGLSFTALTLGSQEQAAKGLRTLSEYALDNKSLGNIVPPHIDEIIPQIKQEHKKPIIIVETSDNIGAGAPGDATGVVRVLLEHDIKSAACVINDPEAVKSLSAIRIGQVKRLNIGGKGYPADSGPLELDVELIFKSDGRFELEDKKSHLASMVGTHIDMGPSAVVRHKGMTILLTSRKTPPFDLGQMRSQGIEPKDFSVIVVKAAVAHKRAYAPITGACYRVDLPGPCSNNLKLFDYKKIKRPIYPLD